MTSSQIERSYKALANRRRLEVLIYLSKRKGATVTTIADHLKLSVKSTSKHLQILRGVDMVTSQQIKLERVYNIQKDNIFIKDFLHHPYSRE